ncbi:MAG: thermonuclease family protein [Betaproteobacteria bacterium]
MSGLAPYPASPLAGLRAAVWLCIAVLCGAWSAAAAQIETVTVTYVADGDTVYVRGPGHEMAQAVRLLGIDAPEICQEGGPAARQALQALLLGQSVTLARQGRDSYGRELAIVYWQGQDVGRWLVEQGLAWSYHFGRDAGPYAQEQRSARAAGLGLFARPEPEPPRRFRQRHGSCKMGP